MRIQVWQNRSIIANCFFKSLSHVYIREVAFQLLLSTILDKTIPRIKIATFLDSKGVPGWHTGHEKLDPHAVLLIRGIWCVRAENRSRKGQIVK